MRRRGSHGLHRTWRPQSSLPRSLHHIAPWLRAPRPVAVWPARIRRDGQLRSAARGQTFFLLVTAVGISRPTPTASLFEVDPFAGSSRCRAAMSRWRLIVILCLAATANYCLLRFAGVGIALFVSVFRRVFFRVIAALVALALIRSPLPINCVTAERMLAWSLKVHLYI